MQKLSKTNLVFIGVVVLLGVLVITASLFGQKRSSTLAEAGAKPTISLDQAVTQTIGAIMQSTAAAQPTLTPIPPTNTVQLPTSTAQPPTTTPFVMPASYYIRDISGNRQYYALGCEASAAVDLAWYYDVNIYQYDFQVGLPHSDNPDQGFVGDVNGPWGQIPPYAYGVHAGPVADLLNQYGVEVEGGKGYTLDQVKTAIAQSKPVIVWVIGHMEYSEPVQYTDAQGNISVVAPYEHVVILTGFNETTVRYLNNGKYADVPNETFLTSWGVLGNMAVFHK